jgi:SAM-dependent methyltransferase
MKMKMKMNLLTNLNQFDLNNLLELSRGYFEYTKIENGELLILGWMFSINDSNDVHRLYLNGELFDEKLPEVRLDVKNAFPNIENSENSGFKFHCKIPEQDLEKLHHICIVGCKNGIEQNKLETWYDKEAFLNTIIPPSNLTFRVAHVENPYLFVFSGMKTFGEFWNLIIKYRDPLSIDKMLDWGCGCGRTIQFFLKYSPITKVFGCDVDDEAINWCKNNISSAEFSTIPFFPPTAYSDNSFDLIVSYSIFTHLTEENQAFWLQEMNRILVPGGIFITTVHGEFAAMFSLPQSIIDGMLVNGIYDGINDETLAGVAPEDYYRATFQNRDYTCRTWAKYFTVLEYKERYAGNFQDMVVLKKEL